MQDTLWAPWRMEYVKRDKSKAEGCIFCEKYHSAEDEENLVLYRMEHSFVLMNLYPYNNGHLLIAPVRHQSDYTELTAVEQSEMAHLTTLSVRILMEYLHPQGFNIGMNIGVVGGAGIADHIHQHIVPRWTGDTNFMPVIGHTKVMVEGLAESWKALRSAFEKLG